MSLSRTSLTRNRRRTILKQTAALLACASLLSGCSLLPQKELNIQPPLVKPVAEKVDAIEVKKAAIESKFTGVATVASSNNVPLFYKESGRLKELYVKQGDKVKAGDLIAELDMGDFDLRMNLEKLNLERAQIELHSARVNGVTGTSLRMKEIDLEREQLMMDSLKEQYDSAKLISPISGEISYADVKSPGDGLNGYTPLVTIADPTKMWLVHTADDGKTLSAIQKDMQVAVTIDNNKYQGKVVQSPSDAPLTGNKDVDERNTRLLYIEITTKGAKLELGKSAEITISLQKHDNVIVIPKSGLRTYLGRTYVQVIDGDRRKEIDVQPGITTSTEVEIVKGLDPGKLVVLNN
ncbi:efflux RND transporter periplasmic adaptor subunit [Paenibacillus sp. OV219]|uniref:efflux RND transporter periplasmic adaptor subunit n=1 Tax=Paenibacillus sp. OV219 TaxID=1884377 RepID=UPI0008C975C0|nr:efflux RND transporter periplasmic adaptor subunit [Paenibacillus sp. OV219]SEO23860.1 RND family efflux transporter, MFP subunit [Paenibacillus sp. OV219]